MIESKNDVAWEKLFEKHRILDELKNADYFSISSSDINKFREARLMTKFDHKSQLPKIFTDNKLSILPVSRGTYIIGKFKTFYEFTQQDQHTITTKKVEFPHFLESLNPEEITSEAIAINCTFIAGILQDFIGEPNLYPTVSGRMSSSSFDFTIDLNENKELFQVKVNKSQIEIDGGYEGDNCLIIIEAKNYIPDDFLVRQLFYPYKLWIEKINKKVRPVFLTYANGIFHLREYIFTNNDYYNSIKLIKQQKYTIQEYNIINIEVIQNILNKVVIEKESKIPFPQADYFERTINLCEILKQKSTLSKKEITQEYGFSSRQADYYSMAAVYLGLIERERKNRMSVYRLTERGTNIFDLSISDRQIKLVELILSHEVFNKALNLYIEKGDTPQKEEIIEIMSNSDLGNVYAHSVYDRRAVTVSCWVNWIMNLIEE